MLLMSSCMFLATRIGTSLVDAATLKVVFLRVSVCFFCFVVVLWLPTYVNDVKRGRDRVVGYVTMWHLLVLVLSTASCLLCRLGTRGLRAASSRLL